MFFSKPDVEQIISQTCLNRIDLFEQLDSTNSFAIENTTVQSSELPWAVIAKQQTSGRGRGNNVWHASEGALTFTLVFDQSSIVIPSRRWHQVSLITAVAVANAIEQVLGGINVHLKWPNDIYCEGRKLCGILVEQVERQDNRLHIGIGINVNNSFQDAPAEIQEKAISLIELLGDESYLPELFLQIVLQLQELLELCADSFQPLVQHWVPRCLLRDRSIEVQLGEKLLHGYCQSINEEGALQLATDQKVESLFAGVVTKF
ncbi:MAG: biotin--[acetyl-CoA-carboxylase] ligase [Blastopirellula sp.]|nr:MAG: biotin--[acetyl-CoA-carboxylase] ligase [Blastopirellula sp.]